MKSTSQIRQNPLPGKQNSSYTKKKGCETSVSEHLSSTNVFIPYCLAHVTHCVVCHPPLFPRRTGT